MTLVHGGSGHRCPCPDERKDSAGVGLPRAWHCRLHVNVDVGCTFVVVGQLSHPYDRDKAGRSVPAPGRGALTIGREIETKHPAPILDLAYRSRQLAFRRRQISQWLENERQLLQDEMQYRKSQSQPVDEEYIASRVTDMEQEAARQEKDALSTYGMLHGTDPRVSPLRRALAVWGLTADDIGVLSIHGTGTGANVRSSPQYESQILTH